MDLLQLRYFQKAAQLESVTKAARFFNIPQPAMSQMIRKLEHELGDVSLFDRRNGHIYLNERGRLFLEYVDRSLTELDHGVREISEAPERVEGPIRIKIYENHRFILTSLPRFSEQYPDVVFMTSHGYFEEQNAEYDICISSHKSYRAMRHAVPFIKEKVVLAVNEANPLSERKRINVWELAGEKFISMPKQSSLHNMLLSTCRDCGFEPKIPVLCDDPYFIRKYISENIGVALAPSISWKGRFRENTVLVPIQEPELFVSSYLLYDDRQYQSPALRRFIEFLLNEVRRVEGNMFYASPETQGKEE